MIINTNKENNTEVTIPSYWQTAMDNAISSAKTKQDIAGNKCINFIMFSDMHVFSPEPYGADDEYPWCKNLGKLAEYASEKLNIPMICCFGDHVAANVYSSMTHDETIAKALENADLAMSYLAPIPAHKLVNVLGNHDINGGNVGGVSYMVSASQGETYNHILRKESQDMARVWDDDGRYFYIDNKPQMTRFICLYSMYWDESIYNPITREVSYRYQKNYGWGQKQIDFLIEALQTADEDWNIVILEHTPVVTSDEYPFRERAVFTGIINAFKARTTYAGSYSGSEDWMNVSVDVDFTSVKSNLVAMFCGHMHRDAVYQEGASLSGLNIPIITITSAKGKYLYGPYSDTETPPREYGTDHETALDIVTIDTKHHNIYTTRIGTVVDTSTNPTGTRTIPYSVWTAPMTSISATYSGGSVPAGTNVNDLQGVTVTGHYSDGRSETIPSGYTLSGTISVGTNTVTVTYKGFTTSFTVVGTAVFTNQIPISTERTSSEIFNGIGYKANTRLRSSGAEGTLQTPGAAHPAFVTGLIPVKDGDVIRFKNCWIDPDGTSDVYGENYGGLYFYGMTANKVSGEVTGTWGSMTGAIAGGVSIAKQGSVVTDENGNTIQFIFNGTYGTVSDMRFVQFTLAPETDPADAIVTVNEEIGVI